MSWALLAIFAMVCIIVIVRSIYKQSRALTPEELLLTIWHTASNYLFEPEKLADWQRWRSRCEHNLTSHEDAFACAEKQLLELGDPYTVALSPAKQMSSIRWESSESLGIGVYVSAAYEKISEEACLLKSSMTGESCKYPTIVGVIYNSPAAKAGLQAGDLITSIDGWSTAGCPLTTVLQRLHGKNRTSVSLGIERDGIEQLKVVERSFALQPTAWSQLIGEDLGYLRLSHFESGIENYTIEAATRLKDRRGIIVDVRDNRGGEVMKAVRLCALFMNEGLVTRLITRVPGTSERRTTDFVITPNELIEEVDDRRAIASVQNLPDRLFAGKPIVVLVNENTASAAELFAGALRDSANATVIGAQTFGKGVTQSRLSLPAKGQMRVTSGRYYLPKGQWMGDGARDRRGMQPHIPVAPRSRLFDMGSDNDLQLSAAIQYLRQNSRGE